MKAVIVTSGGLDSVTNGLMMLKKGYECLFLHFDYKQKCEQGERLSCEVIVKELGNKGFPVSLQVVELPVFKELGQGSSLVDDAVGVVEGIESIKMSSGEIGNLWVPARNVIFIAFAAAFAEKIGAEVITLGCNQSESSYKDNTKTFLDRYTHMLEYGTLREGIKVISPEWKFDKPHILKWGWDNGFGWVYEYTYSCDDKPVFVVEREREELPHRKQFVTCGMDGCCMNRRFAFYVAEKLWGMKDNQRYANEDYFRILFLKQLKETCEETWWQFKYLNLVE